MPIYEYRCEQCNHTFEVIQKINENPLQDCPECNQPKLRKLVSTSAFQLKGTGWYVTDFRNKGNPASSTKSETTSTQSENPSKEKTNQSAGEQSC